MAIELRAMTDEDYHEIRNEVKSPTAKQGIKVMEDSLDSDRLFGSPSRKSSLCKSCARDNIRGYIKLEIPTVNRVLSENGTLLAKILGISEKTMSGIMNYTLVRLVDYDMPDEFLTVAELSETDEFLCGGELLLQLIDEFNLEQAKEECFYGIINSLLKKGCYAEDIGTVERGTLEHGIRLVGGYSYFTEERDISKYLKAGTMEIFDTVFEDYFKNSSTRLSFLLSMKNKDRLYGMINQYIAIIPSGLRPKIDNKLDKVTKLYNKIITKNQDILLTVNTRTSMTLLNQAKDLDAAVSALQYKTLNKREESKQKGAASILERVKSKQGQIRKNNLGKRQDYSGRAAVIVDPYLSISKLKVPKRMLARTYKFHALPYMKGNKFVVGTTDEEVDDMIKLMQDHAIFDNIPGMLGRQPTLHKQSLQGFYVEPTDAHAIEVPPLVCPGFNMDFDGDTAHFQVPLSSDAIYEVSKLLMASQNVYLAKTGECTIVPRQDMLYGLYMCTRKTYKLGTPVCDAPNFKRVREMVMSHTVKVWDTVSIGGNAVIAGYAAFQACFPNPERVEVVEVTSKNIKDFSEYLLENYNVQKFSTSTDFMVELGFRVARLYTMSMSLLKKKPSIPEYDNAMEIYNKNTSEVEYLYSIGMEDDETYNLECAEHMETLQQSMEKHIYEKLGDNSGYCTMAASGARGNKSNLAQMFSYKGRIAASATETINVVIKNSYASGLTPLEGMIAAYGGRKGMIDKSLKTGDTGYASRRMWHTTQGWVITNQDCGTTEGFTITDKDIGHFISDAKERETAFANFITGRYEAGTNRYITKEDAKEIVKNRKSITIRSPLKCKNPCCVKCYGMDPATHEPAVIGLPIGLVAAQSIGEPGTQLTMKQFQKGGVAGRGDVTSNFDRLEDYICVTDLHKKMKKGVSLNYEPIAWETGATQVNHKGDKKIVSIVDGGKHTVTLPDTANIKEYVVKGEGICDGETHGDFYIREIEEISGVDAALKYLVLQLYNLYKDECKIVLTHFEILAASMLHYMIIDTDREDLRIGQYASRRRLLKGSTSGTRVKPVILGVNQIPTQSLDCMATISMERVGEGLARSCALGLVDDMEDPIQRIMLGLPPKLGTHYPNFISERRLK